MLTAFKEGTETEHGQQRINETEATTVRLIFNEYASGKSLKAIALALNKRKVSGPSDKGWGPSTIYGNWRRGTGVPL